MFVFSFGMRHELQISELSAYSNPKKCLTMAQQATFQHAHIAILSQDAAACNGLPATPAPSGRTLSFRYSLVIAPLPQWPTSLPRTSGFVIHTTLLRRFIRDSASIWSSSPRLHLSWTRTSLLRAIAFRSARHDH